MTTTYLTLERMTDISMIEQAKKHIYYGDGKGKTTAAIGLCIRALPYNNRILFASFLKDNTSGEIESLKKLGISTDCVPTPMFTWNLSNDQTALLKQNVELFFESLFERAYMYDLVVLDEVLDVVSLNLLSEDTLLSFLEEHSDIEIVLTGRDPTARLVSKCDYVTCMQMKKHPFFLGQTARKGIEL